MENYEIIALAGLAAAAFIGFAAGYCIRHFEKREDKPSLYSQITKQLNER